MAFSLRSLFSRLPLLLLPALSVSAQDRNPVPQMQAPPQYPYDLSRAGVGGRVIVEFIIGAEGRVVDARALQSTNRGFEAAAVQAVRQWLFVPGMKNGKRVPTRATQIVEFNLEISAVYPREQLLKGQEGRAVVEFAVDTKGRAYAVKVVQASGPEFGAAATASAVASTYAPAFADSSPKANMRRSEYRFLLDGKGDVPVSDMTKKLLVQLKKKTEIAAFSGLDEPPKLKAHPGPRVASDVLAASGTGNASVTVIVDQDGNVLLPQIVSATREEFGYAAVQAVSDWKYEAPRKAGKKVLAEGVIEISFGVK